MASKHKEKLAAVLLNHWFVQQYGLSSGRLKKRPSWSKYKLLSTVENLSDDEILEIAKGFSAWTQKHFLLNIEYLLSECELVKTGKFTSNIKGISTAGTSISLSLKPELKDIIAVRKALLFQNQTQAVSDMLEALLDVTTGTNDIGPVFGIILPITRSSISTQCLYSAQNHLNKIINGFNLIIDVHSRLSEISEGERRDILEGKANLRLDSVVISDNRLISGVLVSEETEDSRITRRAKERLEEAMRRRNLNVQGVKISDDSKLLTFNITNPASSEDATIQIDLDVITSW